MKKRYVWAKDAPDYHDSMYETESCNVDDIVEREEGDTPPEGRRLCEHCKEQEEYEANLGHGDEGKA